jgi:hypothetical protein
MLHIIARNRFLIRIVLLNKNNVIFSFREKQSPQIYDNSKHIQSNQENLNLLYLCIINNKLSLKN